MCKYTILLPIIIAVVFFSYLLTELMETDLHQVIVSTQALSEDHIKVFLYQILRGENAVFSLSESISTLTHQSVIMCLW